jgi:hypothetical protein
MPDNFSDLAKAINPNIQLVPALLSPGDKIPVCYSSSYYPVMGGYLPTADETRQILEILPQDTLFQTIDGTVSGNYDFKVYKLSDDGQVQVRAFSSSPFASSQKAADTRASFNEQPSLNLVSYASPQVSATPAQKPSIEVHSTVGESKPLPCGVTDDFPLGPPKEITPTAEEPLKASVSTPIVEGTPIQIPEELGKPQTQIKVNVPESFFQKSESTLEQVIPIEGIKLNFSEVKAMDFSKANPIVSEQFEFDLFDYLDRIKPLEQDTDQNSEVNRNYRGDRFENS